MSIERFELVEVFSANGEPAKVRRGEQLQRFIAKGYSRDKPKKRAPKAPAKDPAK